jgi:hypothetical protein
MITTIGFDFMTLTPAVFFAIDAQCSTIRDTIETPCHAARETLKHQAIGAILCHVS